MNTMSNNKVNVSQNDTQPNSERDMAGWVSVTWSAYRPDASIVAAVTEADARPEAPLLDACFAIADKPTSRGEVFRLLLYVLFTCSETDYAYRVQHIDFVSDSQEAADIVAGRAVADNDAKAFLLCWNDLSGRIGTPVTLRYVSCDDCSPSITPNNPIEAIFERLRGEAHRPLN